MDSPFITVHEDQKVRLFARGEKEYYIITPTKQLTPAVQEELALSEYCAATVLEQRGLTFETIRKGQIATLLLDGTASGDAFTLCLTNRRRREFVLYYDHPVKDFDILFEGIPRKKPPRKQNQKPDSRNWRSGCDTDKKKFLRTLSRLLTVLGFASVILTGITQHPAWLILCMLLSIVPLVLEFVYPKYVTLIPSFEKEKEHKQTPVDMSRSSLIILAFLSLMSWDDLLVWWEVYLGSTIVALVIGIILSFAEEFRKKKSNFWVLLLIVVVGSGPVYTCNYIFDSSEPAPNVATVTELELESGYRRKDHMCTVILKDGTSYEIEIGMDRFHDLEVGDEVYFYICPGALGMEYGKVSMIDGAS